MFKKEYLPKMLVCFGIGALIAWIANFIALMIPFQIGQVKWVYLFSQQVSEKSIFPLLAILAIIGGIYLCKSSGSECKDLSCKCGTWAGRFLALFSFLFFAGLITLAIVYSVNIKPLYADIKNQISGEADKVKAQITMMSQANPAISQENVQKGLQDLDSRVTDELKKAKTDIAVNSTKILVSLITFALISLKFAIYLFKMSFGKDNCTNTEA